jgi:RND family efflux transporter MFP subunit
LSGLFSGSSAVGYNLTFNNCDTQTGENAKSSYAKSEAALSKWRDELSSISGKTDEATRELALRNGLNYLTIFRGLLRDMSSLLNQQCALSNTSLSDYRDDVSTANTSIATALTNVSTKLSSINTYKAALRKAESDLALLKAGSDPEEVDAQRARVLDAQAAVRTYEIIAPFGGVVSKQDAKLGEIAYANTELVSVIGDGAYEIEINVPELDITYIKAGNSAHVTFDAYGESVSFDGAVTSVDPAETIVDNVPTYKVKVSFTTKDERIKSGLTANVYIQTATKEGVLTVPSKAITSENGKKIVSVKMPDGSEEKREVVLGIRGNHGEVEVLSGLKEGDNVVIRNASAQK